MESLKKVFNKTKNSFLIKSCDTTAIKFPQKVLHFSIILNTVIRQ